jgi:hypothetical protein
MALQSWKDFMRRWVKAYILSYDAKAPLSVLDKTSKAASDILKVKICVLSFQNILVPLNNQLAATASTVQVYVISDVGFFLYEFHAEYDSNSG